MSKLIPCGRGLQNRWNPGSCGRPRGHVGKHRRKPTKADVLDHHCDNGLQCLGFASCICLCNRCRSTR